MKKLKHLLLVTWWLVATAVSACYLYEGTNGGLIWGVTPTATSNNYHVDYPLFLTFFKEGHMPWEASIAATFNINTGTGIKNGMTVDIPFTVYVSVKPFVEGLPITEIRLQYRIFGDNQTWRDAGIIRNPTVPLNTPYPQALFGKNCIKTTNLAPGTKIAIRLYITDGVNESGDLNDAALDALISDGEHSMDQTIYYNPNTNYGSADDGSYCGFITADNGAYVVPTTWRAVYVTYVVVGRGYRIGR